MDLIIKNEEQFDVRTFLICSVMYSPQIMEIDLICLQNVSTILTQQTKTRWH